MQSPPTTPKQRKTRTPRQAAPAFKPRIRLITGTLYWIESRTHPGSGHQVNPVGGTCTCPAAKHGRGCWHLRWANEYHEWRRRAHVAWRQEQLALAVPAVQVVVPSATQWSAGIHNGPAARPVETGMAALWEAFE